MRRWLHIGLPLFGLLLAACGPAKTVDGEEPCGEGCPAGQICDEETDSCVELGDIGRGVADLAAGFDTAWVGGRAALAAYDRLNRRLLYATLNPDEDVDFTWTSILSGVESLEQDPPMALVGATSGPVLFVERADGLLSRGRDPGTGWQWDDVTEMDGGISFLDAALVPDVGYHILVADDKMEATLLELHGGTVSAPIPVVDGAGEAIIQPPMAMIRLAARTTILAGGVHGGLVSLSWESQSWTQHILVADVKVGAVALMQTPLGVLTLYMDADDGSLYQVTEDELGAIAVVDLASGVRTTETSGLPVRIALGTSDDGAYALYHDVVDQEVRLLRAEADWKWREEASRYQDTPLLPALISIPDYAPLPLGLDLGDQGVGPGTIRVLF